MEDLWGPYFFAFSLGWIESSAKSWHPCVSKINPFGATSLDVDSRAIGNFILFLFFLGILACKSLFTCLFVKGAQICPSFSTILGFLCSCICLLRNNPLLIQAMLVYIDTVELLLPLFQFRVLLDLSWSRSIAHTLLFIRRSWLSPEMLTLVCFWLWRGLSDSSNFIWVEYFGFFFFWTSFVSFLSVWFPRVIY